MGQHLSLESQSEEKADPVASTKSIFVPADSYIFFKCQCIEKESIVSKKTKQSRMLSETQHLFTFKILYQAQGIFRIHIFLFVS